MGFVACYWFADRFAVWLVWGIGCGLLAVLLWGKCGICGVNTGARMDYIREDGRLDGLEDRGLMGRYGVLGVCCVNRMGCVVK